MSQDDTSTLDLSHIQIITHNEIPAIFSSNHEGEIRDVGELRIFYNHPILKKFLPPASKLSFAWAHLESGKNLASHSHADATALIIIYKGSAKITGQINRTLTAGDIIIVPPNCEYSLIDIAPEGLHAISITFAANKISLTEKTATQDVPYDLTLAGLIAHNEQRLKQTLNNSFFQMLRSSTLENPKKRQTFLDALQIFGDYFQIMLFSRQATCFDENYKTIFLQHLHEELGHDELFAARDNKIKINDFILKATSAWFCHQMFLADNIEKTVLIHMILEHCGYYYHLYAKNKVNADMKSEYYNIHTENDEQHAAMSLALLKNQQPKTYQRLHQVLDNGWDMLNAMQNRVACLVQG